MDRPIYGVRRMKLPVPDLRRYFAIRERKRVELSVYENVVFFPYEGILQSA